MHIYILVSYHTQWKYSILINRNIFTVCFFVHRRGLPNFMEVYLLSTRLLFLCRSILTVRLIRAEDIPVEGESISTYVDVHLLPLNLQSHTFQPYDTTINVSFRYFMHRLLRRFSLFFFFFRDSGLARLTLENHRPGWYSLLGFDFFDVSFKQNNNNQLVSLDLLTFILMCIIFKILEIQL